jgi:hypothetical protein
MTNSKKYDVLAKKSCATTPSYSKLLANLDAFCKNYDDKLLYVRG